MILMLLIVLTLMHDPEPVTTRRNYMDSLSDNIIMEFQFQFLGSTVGSSIIDSELMELQYTSHQ